MKKHVFSGTALAVVVVLVSLLGFSSCEGKAKTNEIVVGTYAGAYGELLTKYVLEELKKTNPDLKVIYSLGTDNEHKPKMLAEKGGKGTFDVVLLSSNSMTQMRDNDLLLHLDFSKIPNAQYLREDFKNEYWVPQIFSAISLAYNTAHVPKPDSWGVLFDPKYAGKIGLFSRDDALFASVVIDGADPVTADWMEHFDRLKQLPGLGARIYSSQDALASGIRSGEVWLSVSWRARNALLNVPGSEPIADVVPKEGTYSFWYGAAIPANAPNPEGAHAFLNAVLSYEAQKGFGEEMGYSPTVTNVILSPETLAKIGFNEQESEHLYSIPAEKINALDVVYRPRWEREIVSQ